MTSKIVGRLVAMMVVVLGLLLTISLPVRAQSTIVKPPPVSGNEGDLVDFNGDGYGDLAIGSPRDVITNYGLEGGEVNILYGTPAGLSTIGSELWDLATAGSVMDGTERFGQAFATADFNGDGYTDLAVGSPGKRFGDQWNAGQVNIIYGSAAGLVPGIEHVFSQNNAAIQGVAEEGDEFGRTLAAGDFDGDGFADLAVGVPYEGYEAGGLANMGAVNIIYGSASGLVTAGNLIIHPALAEVDGTPGDNALFGYALDTGDFDGDGLDDLAVGIPLYELAGGDEVGAVEVFYGSPGGISLLGEQLWRQGFGGLPGNAEDGDRFGAGLAAGDFDNNGTDDLAIGAPSESVPPADQDGGFLGWKSGAIHIIYGYALTDGLSSSGNQLWYRGMPGIAGELGTEQFFGSSLLAADFDGNGADDLAVGIHGDSPDKFEQGAVQVFYSNGIILSTANQDIWYQGILAGKAEDGDRFGYALGSADFNGDGYADLAVGVPAEDTGTGKNRVEDAGAANIINGSANGLTRSGGKFLNQEKGLPGVTEEYDFFGFALTR